MLGSQPLLKAWDSVVVLGLFLWGMWSFPIALLGPDQVLVPGDMGDARFNNYVLEHFHQFTSGKVDAYWDAPFMFPRSNVIAYSDNLLGTAPVYGLFRSLGWNRYSSFQLWILVLFALNYWCAFFALRWFGYTPVIAAVGAFVFAFGIHQIGHLNHMQVLPRFMLPLALFFWWKVLHGASARWWLFTSIAVAYQYWCGIYLGFLLVYGLMMLSIAHAIIFGITPLRERLRDRAYWIKALGACAVGGIVLIPLLQPYVAGSKEFGTRDLEMVLNSIPRPVSYFLTDPAAISWRDLAWHSENALPEWWHHAHFMGGVVWVGLLLLPLLLLKEVFRKEEHDRNALVLIVAWALSILFCLRLGNVSSYQLIHALPGFSSMRSIDRFILIQSVFFILLMAASYQFLFRWKWFAITLSIALPVLVALDHRIAMDWTQRWNKRHSEMSVGRLVRSIQEQYNGSTAIAWCPIRPPIKNELEHNETIAINLDAMIAGQEVGIPIVNGYTGNYPVGYMPFFDHMDRAKLGTWCEQSGIDMARVQCVDNIGIPVRSSEKISLWTQEHRTVRVNGALQMDTAHTWASIASSFSLIALENGKHLLLAANDRFIAADLEDEGTLSADAPVPGDFCQFTVVPREDDAFSLQADNGRFVQFSSVSSGLAASAEGLDQALWFWKGPLPDGVR